MLGDPNISGIKDYTEGARVYATAIQAIPDDDFTPIAFTAERYDTDGIHDNSTNNSRLTCKTVGKYTIQATVRMAVNTAGYRNLQCILNGTTVIDGSVELNPTDADSPILKISTIYDLAVGDYVELEILQTTGGALNTRVSANYSPEFMMQRIG